MKISEIKALLPITEVLSYYKLNTDRNHRLSCPWHKDKTPSLQIYPKTNTWTCFSSNCDAGSGDVIDFIMKYEKITKREALLKATSMIDPSLNTKTLLSEVATPKNLVGQAVLTKYYQSTLHSISKSPKAKAYAESRGLDHQKLQLGYCGSETGKSWNKELKESAVKTGILKRTQNGIAPKIKYCLIFPMKNKDGQVVDYYGRSILDNKNAKHFYRSGKQKGLFPSYPPVGGHGPASTTKLILTESIIDAACLYQIPEITNHYSILALYGTNGFTNEHEQAIKEWSNGGLPEHVSGREVILFFDGDEAGRAAVEKYKKKINEIRSDIEISYVETPEGEDVNSLAISHEPEIFTHLLEDRKPFLFSIEKRKTANGAVVKKERSKLITDNPELLVYNSDLLMITILGGIKITGLDRMRVTLKVERIHSTSSGQASNKIPVRHSMDLYHSKQVEQLINKVAETQDLGTTEVTHVIANMTTALEEYRQTKLEALKPRKDDKLTITESEKREAIKYLKHPKLLRNTINDIQASGVIGEQSNAMIAYLAYTSRKREKPLHIMCLGASGTGKTYLQESVSELIPEEDKLEITTLSDNAFYYFGREELKHKLILIEDLDGAENVLYPLRELQSKRRISKTVTLKDNKGNLKTITLRVEGPVCVSGCTTREKVYEDNANRCILLYIDGSQEQDQKIMIYQRSISAGKINSTAERKIKQKLKNVQRMLKPIRVVNPYAELIELPDGVFKPRRTLMLLLGFIETITYYHQYQRTVKKDEHGYPYIESTPEDIEAAFALLKDVIMRKGDELTNACRTFLERLKHKMKSEQKEVFGSKEIRDAFRLPPSTLQRYLYQLERMNYIKVKNGNRYRGYEYQINKWDDLDQMQEKTEQMIKGIMEKVKAKSEMLNDAKNKAKNGHKSIKESGPVTQSSPVTSLGY